MEPVIFLGCPHYGNVLWPTCAALLTASMRRFPLITGEQASLLCHNFNRLWCEALNLRVQPNVPRRPTHFAMLHADLAPDPGWLDVLYDELERTGADVISVVNAIKDHRGLTSTGLMNRTTGRIRRLTMSEIMRFPETFDAAGCGHPDKILAVNTGCWLARLDRPWVDDFPGFTILDGVQRIGEQRIAAVLSEDWHASRWWADNGVKVVATRKVVTAHYGGFAFRNDSAWGSWQYDKGDGAVVPGGEIEGWMSHEELAWLKERASACELVVEIGSWHGRSTKALAEGCPGRVVAVDHFEGSPNDPSFALAEASAVGAGLEAREAFHRNLREELASGKVDLRQTDSVRAAAHWNGDGSPDLVFIDGSHDTESVRQDIRAWLPLVRKGGLLSGHDATDPRVRAALDDELPGWQMAGAGSIWEYPVARE